MYDNIYLRNRIGFTGNIKKKEESTVDKILKTILWCILSVLIVIYLFNYFRLVGFALTMDLLFESLISSSILKADLFLIVLASLVLYYCFRKPKTSVAFQIDNECEMLSIVFNEGKWQGMEYHILLSEISNVCVYKNNTFSFFCNNIEKDVNGKQKYLKGTIYFSNGDSGIFVDDFQNTFDRNVKYVNKKK